MGTRLYPNTKNPAALEKLAGVPAGTFARLEAVEARHEAEKNAPGWSEYTDGYRQWKEVNDDQALGDLSAFLLYGWGKFRDPYKVAPDCSGRLDDPAKIVLLLHANGLDAFSILPLAEGLHWC